MAKPRRVEHVGYPPRGMRANNAAVYLGISESSFFRLVETGKLPKGFPVKGMVLWDRYDLDAAFENLKDERDHPPNSMAAALGIKDDAGD